MKTRSLSALLGPQDADVIPVARVGNCPLRSSSCHGNNDGRGGFQFQHEEIGSFSLTILLPETRTTSRTRVAGSPGPRATSLLSVARNGGCRRRVLHPPCRRGAAAHGERQGVSSVPDSMSTHDGEEVWVEDAKTDDERRPMPACQLTPLPPPHRCM
ncbi:uncharacterized protein LOC119352552 [Triticum dicoccoides]|uniref:uncharacterized protein LOC119352552 n=1 Tax=Triticum dicoccoides TaxID=85692 RepID=UPI0018908F8F|nr:uncharacterized protein LOC119352552 [Triticum dicoccoides]